MTMTPQQLAAKPAGDDQITRAREIIGTTASLNASLDTFLASNPTRGHMTDFLATLRVTVAEDQLKQKIELICRVAGIEEPTAEHRLMAMQIGLQQEQNAILQNGMTRTLNQMRSNSNSGDSSGAFTALVGGLLLGATLTR